MVHPTFYGKLAFYIRSMKKWALRAKIPYKWMTHCTGWLVVKCVIKGIANVFLREYIEVRGCL